MPSCYRCSPCGHSWPHGIDYRVCPVCKQSCWIDYAGIPMDEDDARSLANEAEFERYYAEHERKQLIASSVETARQLVAHDEEIANLPETTERA